MARSLFTALAVLSATSLWSVAGSYANEPIVGQWRAPGGGIVEVAPCGGEFCATVVKGEHSGKSVGRMSGSGAEYEGTVTDPREERSYDGTVSIQNDGRALQLEGCALKVFCKAQTWTRL